MSWLSRLAFGARALARRTDMERDLDDEMQFHLEMEAGQRARHGMDPAAARAKALRDFGGVDRTKDACRDSWGIRLIEDLRDDVTFAIRTLRKAPGFTLIVVLTLAIGIGATSAIFSAVDNVLLAPLPYGGGNRLVHVHHISRATAWDGVSPLDLADFRAQTRTLDGLVEYHSMPFTLLGRGDPLRVQTGVVSADYFDLLGVAPILGRTFRTGEDQTGAEPVLVLSYNFWRRAFGSDPTIVGQTFTMNDRVHTVVGVLPPLPHYKDQAVENDVYMPVSACPFRSGPRVVNDRTARMLKVFGRLKPGISLDAAQSDLKSVAQRLYAAYPAEHPTALGLSVDATTLRDELTQDARPTLLLLLATAVFVLVIVCANVANLSLARLMRRERELAVRTALGAGRHRLLRQLLTEGALLAGAGGALGLLLAFAGLDLLRAFAARFTPRAQEIHVNGTVLLFTLAIALLTALACGLLPALWTRASLVGSLKEGGEQTTTGRRGTRVRGALIVGQIAVSFVLLVGAGLMIRSLVKLQRVDPGFNPQNVLTARIDLNWSKYANGAKVKTFSDALLQQLSATPGVRSVAVASRVPLNGATPASTSMQIEKHPVPAGQPGPAADQRIVSQDYFSTVGMSILRGRAFTVADAREHSDAAIINQAMARRYWGREDPIGTRVSLDGGDHWLTIVGVVGDVKQYGLDRDAANELYQPWEALPIRDMRVAVRTVGDAGALGERVRDVVRRLDPAQPVVSVETLEQFRDDALASPRLTTILLVLFAAIALAVAATGLLGVIAFSVSQRTHEIAIRMALGAARARVLTLVVGQGLTLVTGGLALGLLGALGLANVMTSLLFDVGPTDPLTFVVVAVVLFAVAVLASLVPAGRATRISPIVALRSA
jgi:putative ABC transport system permease protein